MTGCKTDEAREFYLRLSIANRYTKRELDRQIGSMLYEQTMISHERHLSRRPAACAASVIFLISFANSKKLWALHQQRIKNKILVTRDYASATVSLAH